MNGARRAGPESARKRVVLHTRVVTGPGGGPDKTILLSPRALEPFGYEAVCVFMRHPADPGFAAIEERAGLWRAPLEAVDDRGPLDWRVPRRLASVCRRRRPVLWHGHDYKSNLLGLMLRRSGPQPMRLVTTVHGWVTRTWKTPVYYSADRLCLRFYDRVICVSEGLRARCLRLGIPPERCVYVPNGIDTEVFRRRRERAVAKRSHGASPERLLIGAAGRLSGEKGFELLIDAVAALVRNGVDAELWIVGEGGRRAALQTRASRLALGDRVRLLGFRPDIGELYEAMDIFALSSVREGLPNVLLEAMALELPVVATRVAGVPSLIKDGENGLLVDPGAAGALESGLAALAADRELRRRLGRAGRETVERSYSFARRMERIAAIYDQVLA